MSASKPRTLSLYEWANRAKARWLKRVMYSGLATSTQKCLAYAIADHLNCVTLDCWPAHQRLARELGLKSNKTIQRAAIALKKLGAVKLTRIQGARATCRYAPIFSDEDMTVRRDGQQSPASEGTDVHQSTSDIHLRSDPTATNGSNVASAATKASLFNRRQRGALELNVAAKLGADGWDILGRLGLIDDTNVERLCRAEAEGTLDERVLAAAIIAARQSKR